MRRLLLALALILATTTEAWAQDHVSTELSMTSGASTDEVTAGALQGRVFGDVKGVRLFGELSWATVSGPTSDAFGAAYPYVRRVKVMDAYAERMFRHGVAMVGVRGGQFRTPFGIYSSADHAYGGFLRAPLIRYAGYWALSNTFLERGVNVVGGVPALQAEYTVGTPADSGDEDEQRRAGTDQVVRVQGYLGSLVVGASHIRTQPYQPQGFSPGRAIFSGVDARWMHGGVQVRGEWIDGQPFDRMHTRGGYLDAFVHRREMGPFSAMARIEVLDCDSGERSVLAKRATVGTRIHLVESLYAQVNLSHQRGALYTAQPMSTDVAVTYTLRYPR